MASPASSALALSGLLLVAAGFPLMRRRVPPNRWYGIRLPATLADERIWYSVNERSGRDVLTLGATITVFALGAPRLLPRWSPEFHVLLVAFVLIVGLAAVTGRAIRHVKHLRRD
jgi:uncharacterized membrane protein